MHLRRLLELQEEAVLDNVSPNELEALKMESDTWALLQALMSYVSRKYLLNWLSMPRQTTENHTSRISPPARSLSCEPIHATSHTRAIHHARVTTSLRSRGGSRMAPRFRAPTNNTRRDKWILAVHAKRSLAGQADRTTRSGAGDRAGS